MAELNCSKYLGMWKSKFLGGSVPCSMSLCDYRNIYASNRSKNMQAEVLSVAAWVYEPFVLEQTVERKQKVYKIMENMAKRKRKTII